MKVSQQVLEWQAEGRAEERIESILQILATRFPDGVPADIVEAIRTTRDLTKLRGWTTSAANASSLDEFRRALQNGGT